MDKIATQVARRVLAALPTESDLTGTVGTLRAIQGELRKFKAWSTGFDETLDAAQKHSTDAPDGLVWQDDLVEFWAPFGPIQQRLFDLEDKLDPEVSASVDQFIDEPRAARIEEAINDPKFLKRDGQDAIAYSEKELRAWYAAFTWWVEYGISGINDAIQRISV